MVIVHQPLAIMLSFVEAQRGVAELASITIKMKQALTRIESNHRTCDSPIDTTSLRFVVAGRHREMSRI